jgi:hypothetical protein
MGQPIFFNYRKGVSERYAIIFEQRTKNDDENERRLANQNDFASKWGWYGVIYNMSNGDITKQNQILKMTAEECFTFLCYSKDYESMKNRN